MKMSICKYLSNQVPNLSVFWIMQNKEILQRFMPDGLKLEIAKKIENSLFSKVEPLYCCSFWNPAIIRF